MTKRIFWSGFPGPCGGANTECYHTARMLREHGVDVTFIPTGFADKDYRKKLEAIGCKITEAKAEELSAVDGLKDSIVISMCNSNFIAMADVYRKLGCRIIWVNCMTFSYPPELKHYQTYGKPFEVYVFQSEWQRKILESVLSPYGYTSEQGHLIRGAFYHDEFPFNPRPHPAGTPFVIGRISRAAPDKFSSNLWPIYKKIPHPIKARVMAWNKDVQRKCGPPPRWAKTMKSCEENAYTFLSRLHAMVHVNGGAGENWPRSGLEAMSAGVPLVVQNQWGWKEMVRHGETGYLCNDDSQLAYYTAKLAYEEDHRMAMIQNARNVLVEEYADMEKIWEGWEVMLDGLG